MTEKLKLMVLKALMFGYAEITRQQNSGISRDEFFYKHALEVCKFFTKQKPAKVNKYDRELLDMTYRSFVSFDAEYFADKFGSPYLCMLSILDYLVNEKRDLSLRAKFGHLDYPKMQRELFENQKLHDVAFDSQKYLSEILKRLGL